MTLPVPVHCCYGTGIAVIHTSMEKGPSAQIHHDLQLRSEVPKVLLLTHAKSSHSFTRELTSGLQAKFSQSFGTEVLMLTHDPLLLKPAFVNRMVVPANAAANDFIKELNSDDLCAGILLQYDNHLANQLDFHFMLKDLTKPKLLVLQEPAIINPSKEFTEAIRLADAIVVKTSREVQLLTTECNISPDKIFHIPDGIHAFAVDSKSVSKKKKGFTNRTLLAVSDIHLAENSFKNILNAYREVVKTSSDVLLLLLTDSENLEADLNYLLQEDPIRDHIQVICARQEEMCEYLSLADLYLAPGEGYEQAANLGTASGCGCAIISSASAPACDLLANDCGMIIDFSDTRQIIESINFLLFDIGNRKKIRRNLLRRVRAYDWENTILRYASLFRKYFVPYQDPDFDIPAINHTALPKFITQFGALRTSDPDSGYSLEDNLHALLFLQQAGEAAHPVSFTACFSYLKHCLQEKGYFLNYSSSTGSFTEENNSVNLAEINGKAIWVLGSLAADRALPPVLRTEAGAILQKALGRVNTFYSPQAIACTIKGLHCYNKKTASAEISDHIKMLADKLVQSYQKESGPGWSWFESFLSHPASVIPSALLCAYEESGNATYKEIAVATLDFFISYSFDERSISINPAKNWLRKKNPQAPYRTDACDIMHLIVSLHHFYETLKDVRYLHRMKQAFDWFLGNNEQLEVVYHSSSGECYEAHHVYGTIHAETFFSFQLSHSIIDKYARDHIFAARRTYRAAS